MPNETRQKVEITPWGGGAPARLFNARKKALVRVQTILANHGENAPFFIRAIGADDWRRNRSPRFTRPAAGSWQAGEDVRRPEDRAYYVDSLDSLAWRQTGRADDVCSREGSRRVDHKGWFTEPDDSRETLSGYVLQLPAREGKPCYVPAIASTAWEGATVRPLDIYDSAVDAAAAADAWAERDAESERDYQSARQAGVRWADAGQEVRDTRRELLDILAERRQVKSVAAPTLCDVIRSKVASLLATIRETREEREALATGEAKYFYFYPGEKRLRLAFNEGADAAVLPA